MKPIDRGSQFTKLPEDFVNFLLGTLQKIVCSKELRNSYGNSHRDSHREFLRGSDRAVSIALSM